MKLIKRWYRVVRYMKCVDCDHKYCEFCNAGNKYQKKRKAKGVTHFDRIKAMSVEEMAKYIYEHDDDLNDVICKTIYPECPWGDLVSPDNCLDCIKKYLESEVSE